MTEFQKERFQKWSKIGRLFDPQIACPSGFSHGSNPILFKISGSVCRVFFTSRDKNGHSHIFRGQFDVKDPIESFQSDTVPVLSPGRPGHFDDVGTMATSIFIDTEGKAWLFYVGWNVASNVPFRNALGLAEIFSDGEVRRFSDGPLLDRSIHDPCFIASACATKCSDGYLLYYTSGEDWIEDVDRSFRHRYRLKIARSTDLINWQRSGDVAVDYANVQESCITSPCVIRSDGKYRMWFSFRGDEYRIGYAESDDGVSWQRLDRQVLLAPGEHGWDDKAVCYPNVFQFEERLYMLYNGNGYGASGFGLAVLNN